MEMMSQADARQAAILMRFFKCGKGEYGEGDVFLGVKVPVTRAVVNAFWKQISFAHLEECIASPYHEVRLAALLTLLEIFNHARSDEALQQRCIDFYLAHTENINNWDLVDLSCYKLLGEWISRRQDGRRGAEELQRQLQEHRCQGRIHGWRHHDGCGDLYAAAVWWRGIR